MKNLFIIFLFAIFEWTSAEKILHSRKSEALFPSECGLPILPQGRRREARIVGGNDASFGEYPWNAILTKGGTFLCGATLINSQWVITPTLCTNDRPANTLKIILGEYDYKSKSESLKSEVKSVAKVIAHPKREGMKHDVALVKLSSPVQFKPHIQPICLPMAGEDEPLEGKMAKVSGWGYTFYRSEMSPILQEVSLPILKIKNCESIIARLLPEREEYDDKYVCAGYILGKRAICNGDAGSPLQMRRKDGRRYVLGLTSMMGNTLCGERNGISLFIRVSDVVPWMRKTLMAEYHEE